MNFLGSQFLSLSYYIPLIIEGNKRGMLSKLFIRSHGKYSCTYNFMPLLQKLQMEYQFKVFDICQLDSEPDEYTFSVEGSDIKYVKYPTKHIILTNMTDFTHLYGNYQSLAYRIIFINEHLFKNPSITGKKCNITSNANRYYGNTKYDLTTLGKNYSFFPEFSKDEKYALVIYPRTRDIDNIDISKIYSILKRHNLKVLVKSRAKDICKHPGDVLFYDVSLYPHTTLALIHLSEIVINFSSTAVEEIIMLEKPFINYNIKPFPLLMPYLYEHDFCRNYNLLDEEELEKDIRYFLHSNLKNKFKIVKDKFLCNNNTSEIIMNDLFGNGDNSENSSNNTGKGK